MRVLVALISQHKLLLKTAADRGGSLIDLTRIPPSVSGGISFLFYPVDARSGGADISEFERKLFREAADGGCEGVVVLYEEKFGFLLSRIRDSVFAASIPNINYIENIHNFLSGQISVLVGNFGVLCEAIASANKYQAAVLPLKNFHSRIFNELLVFCRQGALDRNFKNNLLPRLNRVMELRGPKRRSTYPHLYFKDEDLRYFKYGHEKHSRYETGGDHLPSCQINACFRFGRALEEERHFNVTVGDSDSRESISCQLPNCHGVTVSVKDRSHINMFSSDFHK